MTTIERTRKSERLSSAELKAFRAWVASQHTQLDAAELLGIYRTTLTRVQAFGSCHPSTAIKIREIISNANTK